MTTHSYRAGRDWVTYGNFGNYQKVMDQAKTGEKSFSPGSWRGHLFLGLAISFAKYPIYQGLFVVLKHICSNQMFSWVPSDKSNKRTHHSITNRNHFQQVRARCHLLARCRTCNGRVCLSFFSISKPSLKSL